MAFFGNTGGQNPFNSWVGYGGDGSVPSGVPDAMSGVGASLSQNAATPPKRSFFGKLANALGNDDAQMNFAAAAAYASGKPEVAAQIIAAGQRRKDELQQYEQRQKDERDNWLYEKQWELDHQPPKSHQIENVDGILYDVTDHKPIYESPYPKVYQGPQGGFVQQGRIGIQGLTGGTEAPGTAAVPVTVKSKEERDALPPGTPYIAPDGQTRVKGGSSPVGGSGGFPL
jgi:hypothetical protein